MQKEIYILRGILGESYNDFKNRMFGLVDSIINAADPATLKVTLTTKKRPAISIIPFKKQKVAVFSVSTTSPGLRDHLSKIAGFAGGYSVEEVVPVVYEKTWSDMTPTPGVCLLTLFHSKPSLDHETFLDRWFNGHTPLSLKLHPLWNYNRNEVKNTLTENSEPFDGIVEEQFRSTSDLLNPFIFFGPPLKVLIHMWQVLTDTRSFIDMKRIETYFAEEIVVKSKGG